MLLAAACATPTATPAPTTSTPYPTATEAATAFPPTATSAATPILAAQSIIGILPTPTPTPTLTLIPTATPFPTPRAESTAADKDICRRTPSVPETILRHLPVKLCAAVSPRELFRIDQISLSNIRHPDDLAGFDNRASFTYYGALNQVHFADTPALAYLQLPNMLEWPAGWSFADLPDLERLELTAEGAAACQLFDRPTLERLFAPLARRLNDMALYFQVRIPPDITEVPNLAAAALGEALGLDRDQLEARKGAEMVGREVWDAKTAEERADTLASYGWADNANIFPMVFSIEISESYGCGEN